jgi:hypothetical protein
MSPLWLEIEKLVLDGVPLSAAQGRRLAQLTEISLERLLLQRGMAARLEDSEEQEKDKRATQADIHMPVNANEARWAEEIALAIYRAMDRSV